MGPLKGMRIVEIGGIGPGPFCAQMLADMGAKIIRVDRKTETPRYGESKDAVLLRGRRTVNIDLKKPKGVEAVLKLVDQTDALIEGFRPGVMERLGLGPEVCLRRNHRLVYGRMTGWGQEGPLAKAAGHDINYLALSGTLHAIGPKGGKPVPPLNIVGDYGGGGMFLAFGIMCAIYEAQKSGEGQVVDTSIVDGSAALMGTFYSMHASGSWSDERGTNFLDGGAHFYDTYETADHKWISIGSLEPQFYALLLKYTGIDDPDFNNQMDKEKWPELKEKIATIFKLKSRDEWCKIMEGTDVCFAPVLTFDEAINHPHNVERKTFIEINGAIRPSPAPRFSRTKPEIQTLLGYSADPNESALREWNISEKEIKALKTDGAI